MEPTVVTKEGKIGIIIGSNRTNRLGESIAKWYIEVSGLLQVVTSNPKIQYEIIDLNDWKDLPIFSEVVAPMSTQTVYGGPNETIKKWSEKISSCSSYIIISPEYNYSVPAALKNAIDHIYYEWNTKPIVIVAYGFEGGNDVSDHLLHILTKSFKMRVVPTRPKLLLTLDMYNEVFQIKDIKHTLKSFEEISKQSLSELIALL